jgi:phosphomannomutase
MLFPNHFSQNISATASASIISASQEFVSKVFSFFSAIPELARTVFSNRSNVVVRTSDPPPKFNGVAVVPSSDSEYEDEVMKQRIRDSFSDEVQVRPDESGTAGIITPVFRKAKGDDFIYVLVPVQE